jgi:hypothetical protein
LECHPSCCVGAGGGGTPFEPESSGDGDEEEDEDKEVGEITPSSHSLLPEDLPSLGDLFSQQAGISICMHRMRRLRTGTRVSSDPFTIVWSRTSIF